MTEEHTKELEEAVLSAEANLNEVKADLEKRNEETQKSLDDLNQKMIEALSKITNQKQKIEELEEKN
jgi:chromosome segregation ATPase